MLQRALLTLFILAGVICQQAVAGPIPVRNAFPIIIFYMTIVNRFIFITLQQEDTSVERLMRHIRSTFTRDRESLPVSLPAQVSTCFANYGAFRKPFQSLPKCFVNEYISHSVGNDDLFQ